MKSSAIFLIGIFTGIAAAYMVGSAAMQYALLKTGGSPPPTEANGLSNRYQIVFSPHARADVYLLDTSTGAIWQPKTYTDLEGQPEIWVLADWAKTKADFWDLVNRYGFKKDKAPKPAH